MTSPKAMTSPEAKNLGVVYIFNIENSSEHLAALKWATAYSPQSNVDKAVILLVKKDVNGSNEHSKELFHDELFEEVPDDVNIILDMYRGKFSPKNVTGVIYTGLNIQTMLQGAIEEFKLDTLVLGRAALGNEGCIDLLLGSECTVVLVKNPKPLTMLKMSDQQENEDVEKDPTAEKKNRTDEKKKGGEKSHKNKGTRAGK